MARCVCSKKARTVPKYVNGINGRTRIIRLNKPSARETARAASLSGWVGAASRPYKK